MKKVAIIVALMALSGCGKSASDTTSYWVLPEGLKDCKIFSLQNNLSYMNVVRCPNSITTTSYKSGKTSYYQTVIDGGVEDAL